MTYFNEEKFEITNEGVISLKTDYRKDGNKLYLLPENLIIPDRINDVEVVSLSNGMFEGNSRIITVTLPQTISKIPQDCFKNTIHLLEVLNTENITEIGNNAFETSRIEKAAFPNLTQLGINVFQSCVYLKSIDIGKVTTIPDYTFDSNERLEEIIHSETITTVGFGSFYATYSLKKIDFAETLTNIGGSAFLKSGVRFYWGKLTNCTFGDYATPYQCVHGLTSDYYDKSVIPYANPIVKPINQTNSKWKDKYLNGESGLIFNQSCFFFSVMNAYCGIRNVEHDNPYTLTQINNAISNEQLGLFNNSVISPEFKKWAENLGFVADVHSFQFGNGMELTDFDKIKDHLRNGGYCVLIIAGTVNYIADGAHAILAYGINEYDEIMFVNSASRTSRFDEPVGFVGSVLLQNLVSIHNNAEGSGFVLLTPKNESMNLPLIDNRFDYQIDKKINSATGTFTPTEDTTELIVTGLDFRPTEFTVVSSVPQNADTSKNVNVNIMVSDELKDPLGKHGVSVATLKGTVNAMNLSSRNAFEFYNDGFKFKMTPPYECVFKAGYTYTWYATGKRDVITQGFFVLNEDTEMLNIDFGALNPSSFTIFADGGTLEPNSDYESIRFCTLKKLDYPAEQNLIVASLMNNDTTTGIAKSRSGNYGQWDAELEDGHYKFNRSLSMGGVTFKFAKGIVYRWTAIA